MILRTLVAEDTIAADALAKTHSCLWQTSTWAEIQKRQNIKECALGAFNDGKLIGLMRCFIKTQRFGKQMHCIAGPLCSEKKIAMALVEKMLETAKKEKAYVLRMEACPWQLPYQRAARTVVPSYTRVIPIESSTDEIVKGMKPKGRYNIKVAKRHGVVVKKESGEKAVDIFFELLQKTTVRDGFAAHQKLYYKDMLEVLEKENSGACFIAWLKGVPVAGVIITFCGEKAMYYYGASDHNYRKVMAPYLLQWQALLEAKEQGCTRYDLLGIAPPNAQNHPLSGVSAFKEKLGGAVEKNAYHFDVPLHTVRYFLERIAVWKKG